MSRYRITIHDERHSTQPALVGNRLTCDVDGRQVSGTLIQSTPPYYAMQLDDGRLITCTVTTQGSTALITSNGQAWSGTISELYGDAILEGNEGDSTHAEIRAPMPGRVVAVHHTAGTTVSKGDAVVVIEAMKMQNALTAPRAGTIEKIHVKMGDAVEAGQLLVVISS